MNISELNIGDWVMSTFSTYPQKIESISKGCGGYYNVKTHHINDVKDINSLIPIPLSEEILKANGFIGNILSAKENVIRVFMLGSDYPMYIEGDYSYSLPSPKYVHELQHALRLCGLNDLADNFKLQ